MSKKKFLKNPDYLTQDSQAEVLIMTSEPSIASADSPEDESVSAVNKLQSRHKISKKFGSHLDALFQEPMTIEAETSPSEAPVKAPKRTKKVLPRMGLDSLIRNTRLLSGENAISSDEQKRVTFIYSKNQLEKIRQISKFESRFMKDIIGEAVNQWLEKYERKLLKSSGI